MRDADEKSSASRSLVRSSSVKVTGAESKAVIFNSELTSFSFARTLFHGPDGDGDNRHLRTILVVGHPEAL